MRLDWYKSQFVSEHENSDKTSLASMAVGERFGWRLHNGLLPAARLIVGVS
jgi:hypothetical protein